MRLAILLLLAGCASVPVAIAEQRKLEGDLMTHLGGCVDGDVACRCFWVQEAIRTCVSRGYERHCADDRNEMNRGQLGCDSGGTNVY